MASPTVQQWMKDDAVTSHVALTLGQKFPPTTEDCAHDEGCLLEYVAQWYAEGIATMMAWDNCSFGVFGPDTQDHGEDTDTQVKVKVNAFISYTKAEVPWVAASRALAGVLGDVAYIGWVRDIRERLAKMEAGRTLTLLFGHEGEE